MRSFLHQPEEHRHKNQDVNRRGDHAADKRSSNEFHHISALSLRHLRLMVHDSQTTQELGVKRDNDR